MDRRFAYDHLPEHLQKVSKPFADLAATITNEKALDKLFEAKNLVVLDAARPDSGKP